MAETIKGINVVIGAETTGLSKALSDVNKKSRDIQSELKQVEKLLKLDPSNTELLGQKQKLLADAIANTREKLDRLRAAQEQVNAQFARGEISEGQYRAFQREVAKTEQELRNLEKQLSEVTGEVTEQGKQVSKLGQDYKEAFAEAERSMGNTFDQLKKAGTVVTAAGAGIAAGLGVAVSKAADFEQGMANAFSVMAPDEVAEFKDELKNLALVMGADTKYSATEAARGIEELVKAGVSVQDILEGGLSGALSLATAGELELADAAEIASTALNAFKDDAITVQQAADILAGAANASATSVGELKFGLSQVSAVASGVGLSFEDTVTALAAFAQNGLKGSDAGTSLKTMLMRLQPSTEAAYNEFKRLGLLTVDTQKVMEYFAKVGIKPASESVDDITSALAGYIAQMDGAKTVSSKYFKQAQEMIEANGWVYSSFYDANGELKSMTEIADLLSASMSDLNDRQRQAALETMFGADAIRAANILYKEGADGINNMAEAMGKISAQDVAAQKMDTFRGTIEELSGSLETAEISLGSALLPALRSLTEVIQSVIDGFNGLPASTQSFIATAGAVAAALALITGPMLLLTGYLPNIAAGLKMIGPLFSALTGPIGLTVAAIAGLVTGITLLYNKNEAVRKAIDAAWEAIKKAAQSIFGAIKDFWAEWGDEITAFFRFLWDGIKTVFSAVFKAISDVASRVFNDLKAFWDKWGGTIKQIFRDLWEIVRIVFKGAFDFIANLAKQVFGSLKSFWDRWGDTITVVFRTIWDVIKTVIKGTWEAIKIVIETAVGVISNVIKLFLSVLRGDWKGAWEAIKGIVVSIWDGIKNFLANAGKMLIQIGKDLMRGLIDGIKSMANAVVDSVKDVGSKMIDGIKNKLGIHSPSRVMMQVGKDTGEGLVQGIESKSKDVEKSSEKLGQAAQKAAQKAAQEAKKRFDEAFAKAQFSMKMGKVDTSEYIKALEQVRTEYAKTPEQVRKVTLEIKKAHDQLAKDVAAAAKKQFEESKVYIEARKQANTITLEQELAMWERLQERYKVGTKERIAIDKEVNAIRAELDKQSYEASKTYIEARKQANELSLMDELALWERVQARYKAGTKEREDAEKNVMRVRQEIYNGLIAANETFLQRTKEINARVEAEEKRLNAEYEKAVEERARSIMSFAGLFDEVQLKAEKTGQELLNNLRNQVVYLANWSANIEMLAQRGIDKGLLEELRQMGPKAAPELAALNQLTDYELREYETLWRVRSEQARSTAVKELEGLRKDTNNQIAQLRVDAAKELEQVRKEFESKVKAIRGSTTKEFNAMRASMPDIGKEVINGLIRGMDSMSGPLMAKAQELARSVSSTIKSSLKINSPSRVTMELGRWTGEGLAIGLRNTVNEVSRQAAALAGAAVPSIGGVGVGGLAGASAGGGVINMEGLFAGAVINVRSDNDIRTLAREIWSLGQQAQRGGGGAR